MVAAPAELQPASGALSDFDRRVYTTIAGYAFDEPECWPSQHLIALDLGCTRESVNRSVRRLVRAGWLVIKERRWSRRSGWVHNVYELFEDFGVQSAQVIRRIVRRAHRRLRKALRGASSGPDHTNREGRAGGWCSCGWCRPAPTRTRAHAPPLPYRSRALRPRGDYDDDVGGA